MNKVSVHFSSKKMDWATPPELFQELDEKYNFEVDVCATAENAKVETFFDPETNGLDQTWAPRTCWMNPPYGRDIVKWMKKAFDESEKGALVVCLVPSRTDTAWWHDYAMQGKVQFLRGRLRFVGAPSTAPFPSAVVVFHPRSFRGIMARITHQKKQDDESKVSL